MESKYSSVNIPESKLLLDIINQRQPLRFENIEIDKFIELLEVHNITPLVFYRLSRLTGSRFAGKNYAQQLPEDIYSDLKSKYLANIYINIKFWKEFLKINEVFKQNNVSLLPLKGVDILVRFYPAFDLRSMVDIDILIKEERFARAEKILSGLGYQKNSMALEKNIGAKNNAILHFIKNALWLRYIGD